MVWVWLFFYKYFMLTVATFVWSNITVKIVILWINKIVVLFNIFMKTAIFFQDYLMNRKLKRTAIVLELRVFFYPSEFHFFDLIVTECSRHNEQIWMKIGYFFMHSQENNARTFENNYLWYNLGNQLSSTLWFSCPRVCLYRLLI